MLYEVNLADTPGYVYVLFEHKSYHEKHIHLQLLEYMIKIWRLCIKQDKKAPLPVIIPLLLCHGRSPWPQEKIRFSTMLEGPVEALSAYIPDFSYALYDLTRFSDNEIKGTVMGRVMMLLFKHIFEPDLMEKLPEILSLMRELMEKETGMQYLETVLRYLFNTVDGVSTETIKEIVEQAFSKKEGGFTMTLAERLRMEGKTEGKIEGLRQAIELGMTLKFPDKAYAVTSRVEQINDIEVLEKIKETIKTAKDHSEITVLLN
jgi:predicted transposase/invertase (TIGR01784 family)